MNDHSNRHAEAWRLLSRATVDRRSPMRTVALMTQHADGQPDGRLVVLRQADATQHRIWIHTDTRSPKWAELQRDPRVTVLAWSPRAQLQIRMRGEASLMADGPVWRDHWEGLGPKSRLTYATPLPPGTPLDAPMGAPEPELGAAHFGVVEIAIHRADCLWLAREGHFRLEAVYAAGEVQLRELAA